MRLIDADALREERETAWVSPHPHEEGDKCEVIHVSDLDAAPTVTPTVKVRYDEDAQEWTNAETVVLEAVTDGFWNTPVTLHLGQYVLERRTP